MIRSALKNGLKKVLGVEAKPAPAASPASAPPAWKAPEAAPKRVFVGTEAAPEAPAAAAPPASAVAEAPAPVASVAEAAPAAPEVAAAPAEARVVAPTDDTAGPALTLEAVQEIMDEMVRPALQGDGGDITLLKVEENDVYVKLVGSCSTCPSSIMTMKMGVEALLKEEFPTMRNLIQVD